jgi:hypothetical protein
MRIPVFLLSLVAASLAWGQTLPALGPDTSGQKTKRPEPSSIGPESEPPQPSDSQLPDTIISQKPLPQPAGPPALIKKQPLPKDTSAAHRALEEKNRALFDQLFGDVPKDKKIISDEMASKGTAIHNPHRSHKAIHDVVYTHIEAIKLCYSRRGAGGGSGQNQHGRPPAHELRGLKDQRLEIRTHPPRRRGRVGGVPDQVFPVKLNIECRTSI